MSQGSSEKIRAPADLEETLSQAVQHHKAGNLSQAEAGYRQVLEHRPQNPHALHYLGLIARQVGKLEYAVQLFRQATITDPKNAVLYYNLGLTLQELGMRDEAAECYRETLQLDGKFSQAYNNLGVVLQDLGRMPEANQSFAKAIGANPRMAEAYYNLAQSKHFTAEPVQVEQIHELLTSTDVAPTDKIRLHFSLGKIYDDVGNYAKAFEHYQAGNRLKGLRLNTGALEDFVSRTIEVFDAAFFRNNRLGDTNARPVFIVGMPRSGTTLVEQITASHPQVYGAGELAYFERLTSSLPQMTESDQAYPECAVHLDVDAVRFLANDYINQLQEKSGSAVRTTDKTPLNFFYLGLIALLFPNATIIHCRRDPLDVCLSCYFQNFNHDQSFAYDLSDIGHFYRQYERLMSHWREVLPLQILDVHYEDLVRDQEQVSRSILSFCGLPWDDRCLSFYDTDRIVNTASKWQVRQPVYSTAVGRWRHYEAFLDPLKTALGLQPPVA